MPEYREKPRKVQAVKVSDLVVKFAELNSANAPQWVKDALAERRIRIVPGAVEVVRPEYAGPCVLGNYARTCDVLVFNQYRHIRIMEPTAFDDHYELIAPGPD